MNRIRKDEYEGTPSRGNTPEIGKKGRNMKDLDMKNPQRLISPLKYQRQPRNSGDPIYKIDNKEVIKPKWNRQPIAYRRKLTYLKYLFIHVLADHKTEPIVPLHLEIPFFRESRDRRLQSRMQNWERSLRETSREPKAHQRARQQQQHNQLPYGQYERSLYAQGTRGHSSKNLIFYLRRRLPKNPYAWRSVRRVKPAHWTSFCSTGSSSIISLSRNVQFLIATFCHRYILLFLYK